MSESKALSTVPEAEYDAIESAVMETARGRWFLAEYARRNRNADTQTLLEAIGRIENLVQKERETSQVDRLRFDLLEMAKAISKTKAEIASIRPHQGEPTDLNVASEALDAIVRTTERATSDILEAAEHVQEAAWTLREEGASESMCDELDRRATDIYTACSFQDLTAQRTSRIVNTLRYLEGRINAMIEIWGIAADDDETASGSAGERRAVDLSESLDVFNGLSQDDVDTYIVQPAPAAAETEFVEEASAADAYFFDVDSPLPPPSGIGHPPLPGEEAVALELEEVAWADAPADELSETAFAADDMDCEGEIEIVGDAGEETEPFSAAAGQPDPLADLDALDVTEKLRRFT